MTAKIAPSSRAKSPQRPQRQQQQPTPSSSFFRPSQRDEDDDEGDDHHDRDSTRMSIQPTSNRASVFQKFVHSIHADGLFDKANPQSNVLPQEGIDDVYKRYLYEIQETYGSNESTALKPTAATIEDFMTDLALTPADKILLRCRILMGMIEKRKERDSLAMVYVFVEILIFAIDYISDILSTIQYIKLRPQIGIIMAAICGVSLSFQCIVGFVFGQPTWLALTALIGIKPAVESWLIVTEARTPSRQKVSNGRMLLVSLSSHSLS